MVEEADTFVGGDAVQPGIQTGFFAEIFETLPGFDEGILEEVVGFVVVDHHFSDMPIQPFLVGTHQQNEGLVARAAFAVEAYNAEIDFAGRLFFQGRWAVERKIDGKHRCGFNGRKKILITTRLETGPKRTLIVLIILHDAIVTKKC